MDFIRKKNDFAYAAMCIQDEIKDQNNPSETAKKRLLYALIKRDSSDFEYALTLCNKKYFISLDQYCYINRIFDCYNKTIKLIYYSSENEQDKYQCDLIRGIDNSTFFNEFKAVNNHNLFSVYGKEFVYSKIMNDINKFCGI